LSLAKKKGVKHRESAKLGGNLNLREGWWGWSTRSGISKQELRWKNGAERNYKHGERSTTWFDRMGKKGKARQIEAKGEV